MILYRRPLRFLAVVVGGWIGVRVVLLWPTIEDVPDVVRAIAAVPEAEASVAHAPLAVQAVPSRVLVSREVVPAPHASALAVRYEPAIRAVGYAAAPAAASVPPQVGVIAPPAATIASQPLPTAVAPRAASRLAVSAWLIARPSGSATAFAPQLGGSQAGARITYALDESRRIALAARIASPLGAGQREAAFGVDWQPFAAPIHVFAEQRVALGRGRGGPTAGVVAGLNPTPIAGPLRLEGYGQAGVIARRGGEGFADGALRMGAPVTRLGGVTVDLGAGAWGAAQRGARRIDVGPSAALIAPVGDKAVRVSLDWRQRVAGNARPASGPALSLGTDF